MGPFTRSCKTTRRTISAVLVSILPCLIYFPAPLSGQSWDTRETNDRSRFSRSTVGFPSPVVSPGSTRPPVTSTAASQPWSPRQLSTAAFSGYEPIYTPYPAGGPPPGSVVTLPEEMPMLLPPVDGMAPEERKISDFKDTFFQKASITATWLDRGDLNNIGINELETFLTVAIPAPTKKAPLMISPNFAVRNLDGPGGAGIPSLPAQLYDAFVEFRWLTMWTEKLGIELALIPGIYSDFERWDSDALRIKGRVATLYKRTPEKSLILGLTYLDREDFNFLPIVGVLWTPNDCWRYELVFPTPKVAWRFDYGPDWDDWLYVAGEFGGDTYSIELVPGTQDVLTYRDIRVRVGVERKRDGGGGRHFEIGYAFGRTFEFTSGLPDFEPDGTVMVRGGVAY